MTARGKIPGEEIYPFGINPSNRAMDIWEIRLTNFRSLRDRPDVRTNVEFARRLGMAPTLLQNYIGKNPNKRIGDETVKKAMQAFGLPAIWFDTLHDGVPPPPVANASQIVSWPFAVDRARFESLPLDEKERIGRFVRDTVEAWEAKQVRPDENS